MELSVLRLGLNFCPSTNLDHFDIIKGLHLFGRRLNFKSIFHEQEQKPKPSWQGYSKAEFLGP